MPVAFTSVRLIALDSTAEELSKLEGQLNACKSLCPHIKIEINL